MVDDFDYVEVNPADEIIDIITNEMDATQRRMTEIRDQITSMQSSVEKEQNRYSSIAMELRNIRDNLDTVPREDIRDKYDEALEVRFRLATMRGQLEKFESIYSTLEEQQMLADQILTALQGVGPIKPPDKPGSDRGGLDIIGIIHAQEEERQRLARQMHDGPAQSLTNFILQAEICQRLFDRNPDRAAEELDNLKTNASKTFQKVRDFIFDLRPMMLDDLGVVPTVRRYVESFVEKNDIATSVKIDGEERRLENYREVLIFRGVKDLMAMARDYASPTSVDVQLNMSGDMISFTVDDDGRGFDASALFDEDNEDVSSDARVQALAMLKSKFELVGGSIQVRSSETEGTSVKVDLPIAD